MTNKKVGSRGKATVWVTVLICLYEVLTKGWFLFVLLPLSLVALPLYVRVQYAALKNGQGPHGRLITAASGLLTIFMLLAYICTVGAGDTDQVLLFGFYGATEDAAITKVSALISQISYVLAAATFLLLTIILTINKKQIKQ